MVQVNINDNCSCDNCSPKIITFTSIFYVSFDTNVVVVLMYAINKSEYSQSILALRLINSTAIYVIIELNKHLSMKHKVVILSVITELIENIYL